MLPRGEVLHAISHLYRIPYSEAGGIRLRRGLRLGRFRLGRRNRTSPFRYQITRLDPARCCAAGSGGNQNLTIPHLDNVQHTFAHPGCHVLPRGKVFRPGPYPDGVPLEELLDQLLEQTGYLDMLRAEGFEGQTRLENIEELKSTMKRYEEESEDPTLAGFLEEVSLYTDIDRYDPEADAVVLMTMHSAKGLEFDYVFVAGMEEGIFPGVQSMYDPAQVEEERRLCYVSLTRAKKRLYLSTAAQRMLFGQTMRNRPSRFMAEIPQEDCEVTDQAAAHRAQVVANAPKKRPSFNQADRMLGVGQGLPKAPDDSCDLKPGDVISHKVFGRGMVLSVTPMGNDQLVEAAFDNVGTKKVMARFARLKKL